MTLKCSSFSFIILKENKVKKKFNFLNFKIKLSFLLILFTFTNVSRDIPFKNKKMIS